jgi:uncharacterized damage-inducible protein DinB
MIATKKQQVTVSSLISDYVNYNLWANTTLITWLRMKPEEKMDENVPSSFPSLKLTLLHIWEAEQFWLSVIQKEAAPEPLRDIFNGSVEDVFNGLSDSSELFANVVNSLEPEELHEEVQLVSPWAEAIKPRIEFIMHCMNHGTYHRGQIVTIGRNLGLTDAPMTDFNFYLMNVKPYSQ